MSSRPTGSAFLQWYRSRIGEPTTTDEAYGYWVFALGVLAGILGIVLFLASTPATAVREASIALSAAGLVLLLAGPIIRLPLRRAATLLTYLGVIVSAVAIVWFVVAFPEGWSTQTGQPRIVGLYTVGLALIAIGGVFIPVLTSGPELDPEELAALRDELAEARAVLDGTEADEADLAARLELLRTSQARFELYEGRDGQWRWRLRHRNGNVIATSGEGYTRRHNAQNGLESVRRNALGAALLQIEDEAELAEEGETFEPFVEVASRASFELYEDGAGDRRWRLVHENGNVLADSGEGYASRSGARAAIDRIREQVGPADYLRVDPTAFEVYRDRAGEWRWRLVHRNGNVLADGGQGYASRSGARAAIDRIREDVDGMEIEVYEDDAGEHRWRLRSANNRIMADSGEGYDSEGGADDAVERFREYAPGADVLDIGWSAFEIYEDDAGEHRWRLRHRNGNILADGGEGYSDWAGARDGIESVKRNAPSAETEEGE